MSIKNSSTRFGSLAIVLHWLVALAVYGMFALGLWMMTLGYRDSFYHQAPALHKSIGVLLSVIMLVRIIWRCISPPPETLKSYTRTVRITANITHLLLYLLLVTLLTSGYLLATRDGDAIDVFGLFAVPALAFPGGSISDNIGDIHLYLAWTVIIISVMHTGAALKHHFYDRDNTLNRMLGKQND